MVIRDSTSHTKQFWWIIACIFTSFLIQYEILLFSWEICKKNTAIFQWILSPEVVQLSSGWFYWFIFSSSAAHYAVNQWNVFQLKKLAFIRKILCWNNYYLRISVRIGMNGNLLELCMIDDSILSLWPNITIISVFYLKNLVLNRQ